MIRISSINSNQIFGFCSLIFIFMVSFCYLITKLYKITCSKLGLAGLPKRGGCLNKRLHHQPIKIEFITQTDKTLPCSFNCSTNHIISLPGEIIKINYSLRNKSNNYAICEAVYNVIPLPTSKYFNKLQCFCYNKIIVPPCGNVVLPLVFYIEPNINFDDNTRNVEKVTLTYILNNMKK